LRSEDRNSWRVALLKQSDGRGCLAWMPDFARSEVEHYLSVAGGIDIALPQACASLLVDAPAHAFLAVGNCSRA